MNKAIAPIYKFIEQRFFDQPKSRQDILAMEQWIKNMETSFTECPYEVKHSYADGIYSREIHIPAGHLICGKIHKNDYFINIVKGRVWLASEFCTKELIGPCIIKVKAGTKNIGFHLEDTIWIDFHKVNSTTIEEMEKEIFADSYKELDKYNRIIEYKNMCEDLQESPETIKARSEISTDIINQPKTDYIEIKISDIEGYGVFATKSFKQGEIIATARINNNRTLVGRYTNHSDKPNAEGFILGNTGYLKALNDIAANTEITVDYRQIRIKANELDRGESCLDS